MLKLVPVKEEEIPLLVKLYLKGYEYLKEYAEKDEKSAYNYLMWLYTHCSGYFYKAEFDGEIAGFIAFDPHWKRGDRENLEIHELVVHPAYRKRGIGKEMITFAVEVGVKNNNTHAFLWVGKNNTYAIEWYKKLGFSKVGEWGRWLRFKKRIV